MSWVEEGSSGEPLSRTIIFVKRATIKKVGGTTLRFKGHEVTLIKQWRGHPKLGQSAEISAASSRA